MVAIHGAVVDQLRDNDLEQATETLTEIIITGEQRLLEAMSKNQRMPGTTVEAWPSDDVSSVRRNEAPHQIGITTEQRGVHNEEQDGWSCRGSRRDHGASRSV